MKVLFIHRSVGHNLIIQGKLRELLRAQDVALDDYDNNTGVFTNADHTIFERAIAIPGNNTNPDNLAQYFTGWDDLLDRYDSIIIKSCYPNSHIKNEAQLVAMQRAYSAIIDSFTLRQKQLIVLTSPPLRPLLTNRREAEFTGKLSECLLGSVSVYVSVLDFHALLAEPSGRHKGMLRKEYRRLLPFDNHPNAKANIEVAPLVANFIRDKSSITNYSVV